jgi:preprotein translocase subunit SecE
MANKATSYIEEVQKEMQKVSWPKRTELVNNTIITLVSALALALIIFGMDRVIQTALEFVYGV